MAFDVEAAIKDLGLNADDAAVFRGLHGRNPKVAEGFMRQSDYDRRMNEGKGELAKKETELAQAKADLDAEVNSMASWHTGETEKFKAAQAKVAESERLALAARQAVEKLATDAGVDPKQYLDGVTTAVVPPVKPADVPATGVSRDQLASTVINLARHNAELIDIDREHTRLFGERLPNATALLDAAVAEARKGNSNMTLTQIWEGVYKVPEKRTAIQQADIDRRIEDARQAGIAQGRTDAALGSRFQNVNPAMSPVLEHSRKVQAERDAAAPKSSVDSAVAYFEKVRAKQIAAEQV